MFKKLFSALILSSLVAFGAQAQFTTIAQSSEFHEPQSGDAKILKDDKGNTIFLHMDNKGDVTIKTYNTDKKLVFDVKSEFKAKKGNKRVIDAVFTIKDELVIFMTTREDKKPTLSRVLIDLNTGKTKENTIIDQLNKFSTKEGYAVVYGNVPIPGYYIRKDPNSDAYAIVAFNTFASDRNERLYATHYDGKHNIISESRYHSPDEAYKYIYFKDVYVDGHDALYVIAIGENTKKSGGDQSGGLFIGKIEKNSTSFNMTKMSYSNAKNISHSFLKYNPVTDKLMLMTTRENEGKKKKETVNNYTSYLATFDKSLANIEHKQINFKQLNSIAKTQFKKKEAVNTAPNYFHINNDGTSVVTLEEPVVKSTMTQSSNGSVRTRHTYYLKDVGVMKYDTAGNVLAANYIPKSHQVSGLPGGLYYSFRNESMIKLAAGTQFKGFQYLDAPNGSYILINDIPSNIAKMHKGKKMKTIQGVGSCYGFYFKLGGKRIPEGQLIMGKDGKQKPYLFLYDVSHYDKEKNEYVTVKVQNKKARLIWLQPQ